MAIDAYSLCPGGTGKKIKFCCPDFLPELEKVDRMIDAEQFVACLDHIERLEKQPANAERACLMAIKGLLLRATNQAEAAIAHADAFVAKHPANPLALAEKALVTALHSPGSAAMEPLQASLEASHGEISARLYEALGVVAQAMVEDRQWASARALLQLQTAVDREDSQPLTMLMELYRTNNIPLLLKEDVAIDSPDQNQPLAAELQQATVPLASGRWREAERALASLAERQPVEPRVWRALATVRGWLAAGDAAVAALQRYAALDVPLEDAVEAQAQGMLLAADPFGDAVDIHHLVYTVHDAERLQEALLSERRLTIVRVEGFPQTEDQPPPRAGFIVLNTPPLDSYENVGIDDIPIWLGQALLFGKQTDRAARLEISRVATESLADVETLIRGLGQDAIDAEPQRKVMARSSASVELLQRRWHVPQNMRADQFDPLLSQYERRAVLELWPQLKLGVLDGRTPADAAQDPALRVKTLAAIMTLATLAQRLGGTIDFNDLRRQLGLPTLDALEPAPGTIARLPLVRLERVALEKLSDEDLVRGFRRATLYDAVSAERRFALELVARPSLEKADDYAAAYTTLVRTAADPAEAFKYLDEGRRAAEARGLSSARWDLLELSLQFGSRNGQEVLRLVQHIEAEHIEEPGVAEELTHLLIDFGVLRPDGTPNTEALRHAGASPAQPAAEPGQLWTPDSPTSSGQGGGKLWVPE